MQHKELKTGFYSCQDGGVFVLFFFPKPLNCLTYFAND